MLACIGLAIPFIPDSETGLIVGGLAIALGHSAAGVIFFRRSKGLPDSERRPFRLIAAALCIAVVGLLVVAGLGADAPVVGPADTFFTLTYVFLLLALFRLAATQQEGPPWTLTVLDASIGAVATGAIVWEFLLRDLGMLDSNIRWLSAYPVLDVALLVGLFTVALRRSHHRFDKRLLLIGAGLVFHVLADLAYLYEGLNSATFADAQPVFPLWLFSSALLVAAAGIVDSQPARQEFPDADEPLWASIAPYVLAGALVPVHAWKVASLAEGTAAAGTDQLVVMYALLVVGMLVVFRQFIAIRQNRFRVEEQRRDLIASVSHELRTPLTAIMGFLTVLGEDEDMYSAEERAEMMSEVTTAAQHMSRTMTDLITLARDGGVDLDVRPRPTTLSTLVHAAVEDSGLVGEVVVEAPDSIVTLDPDRIGQAVGHLVSNARKYGGSTVEVVATVGPATITIQVHDDGPGIPTRHLNAIWNQLDRGPRRLDASKPGLGMGLPIVRAIAQAHGGTARYERSERLGGSCFAIVVPRKQADLGARLVPGEPQLNPS